MICKQAHEANKRHLGESIPSKAGILLRVALLNDLAAPCGHSAVQQALTDAVHICVYQLRDVVHNFESHNLNALTITLKLHITLKNRPLQFTLALITT